MSKENYVEGISNAPTTFKESVRIALDGEMDQNTPSAPEFVSKKILRKMM
jgi:hypothetical protein